jgi:hypothetical protein
MALVDQEDKGKKENSKESLITNFNKPQFSCLLYNFPKVTLFSSLSTIVILSKNGHENFANISLGTK